MARRLWRSEGRKSTKAPRHHRKMTPRHQEGPRLQGTRGTKASSIKAPCIQWKIAQNNKAKKHQGIHGTKPTKALSHSRQQGILPVHQDPKGSRRPSDHGTKAPNSSKESRPQRHEGIKASKAPDTQTSGHLWYFGLKAPNSSKPSGHPKNQCTKVYKEPRHPGINVSKASKALGTKAPSSSKASKHPKI